MGDRGLYIRVLGFREKVLEGGKLGVRGLERVCERERDIGD